MLGEKFPGPDVDLNYDPTEPTISEVENLGYNMAKPLCEYLLIKRAERMIKEVDRWLPNFMNILQHAQMAGGGRDLACKQHV